MSRKRMIIGLAFLIPVSVVSGWWLLVYRAPPKVRIEYVRNSRSLALLHAQEAGSFSGSEWKVDIREQAGEGTTPDIIAGCMASSVAERLAREPEQWLWLTVGVEEAGDPSTSSVLYETRPFSKDLTEVTDRLSRKEASMFVTSETWAGEARHYFPQVPQPTITSERSEALAQRRSIVILGDPLELAEFARNPQFRRVASNVRVQIAQQERIWDSAYLVRKAFADKHPELVARIESSLIESSRTLREEPGTMEALLKNYLKKNPIPGEKIAVPSLIPQATAGQVVQQWQQRSTHPWTISLAQLSWKSETGVAPAKASKQATGDLPPFSSPRPRDVWAEASK